MWCVRRQQQQKAAAAEEMKLSWTSSASDARHARRSTSASALGYLDPVTSDDIWYNAESSSSMSSTHNVTSSSATRSSSSAQLPHSEHLSPDFEQRHHLHRSSPLAALNSIYVIDHHVSASRSPGGGRVNDGFVGDGMLTDSWRRVSWRARLRAGIARSTISSLSSDSAPSTSNRDGDVSSYYLSDVIDSVKFFSNAGATVRSHARCVFPATNVSVERCKSDGGEWTLRRNGDTSAAGQRTTSLVTKRTNDRQAHVDTYNRHILSPSDSTPNQRAIKRI